MPSLSERIMMPELMDDDATDYDTFRACLVDLARVNQLTLAYRPTLSFLNRLFKTGRLPRHRAVVIVDVGSGYGDMLRKIDHWAAQRGIKVKLIGLDLNSSSARAAADATPEGRPIRWVTANVFDYRNDERPDVIISSLFTHHLDDSSLVRFVAWMEASAGAAWFVNDLHRHPLPYHVFGFLSRALRFHYFVQHDGPISIARAFQASDWHFILARAGLPASVTKIRRYFPFRICVERVCRA